MWCNRSASRNGGIRKGGGRVRRISCMNERMLLFGLKGLWMEGREWKGVAFIW